MNLLIINGVNLNMLGKREKEYYGEFSYEDLLAYYKSLEDEYGVRVHSYQSNIEGELVNAIQQADTYDGLIINPGGYTHTSIAILDALLSLEIPKVEVHLSNIHRREDFRAHSVTARACEGVIAGFGKSGYGLAVKYLIERNS
ncbi:MAG: type II 3-dehydroquinate dehydratase [Bacillota bacterium]|nr:type II 3-dehydroquinate dehydratase [Bacillota bacterium]